MNDNTFIKTYNVSGQYAIVQSLYMAMLCLRYGESVA